MTNKFIEIFNVHDKNNNDNNQTMFDTDKYYFTYFFKLPRLSYFFHYNICQMRKLAKIQIEEELRKFNLNT